MEEAKEGNSIIPHRHNRSPSPPLPDGVHPARLGRQHRHLVQRRQPRLPATVVSDTDAATPISPRSVRHAPVVRLSATAGRSYRRGGRGGGRSHRLHRASTRTDARVPVAPVSPPRPRRETTAPAGIRWRRSLARK